jgi:DNA-binding beta-propeller fold protein YncE
VTLRDTTSLTQTVVSTSTIQGIIPPINEVLISNISLGTYTWGVTVNPSTNTVYAISPLSNLTAINGSTNHIIASIRLGPYGSDFVTVNPETNLVYSGNYIVNGTNNKIIDQLPYNITDVAVDQNTDRIFSLSPDMVPAGNTSLLIFDGSTDSLIGTVRLNGTATVLAINQKTNTAYIPICSRGNVCAPIYMIALNTITGRIISNFLVDPSESDGIPFDIAINPITNTVYMTDEKLISINGSTNTVIAQTIVSAYTIQCRGVSVNEQDNEIYVAGWGFGNYGSFFIVNAQNYSLLNAFAGTGQPVGISYDPVNSEIYVANSQTKSILALNSTAFVLG